MVDDYGHHPTEIRATLDGGAAVRLPAHPRALPAAPLHAHVPPDGRVRARRFTRPTALFVMDIYAASEQPIEGVTAESLVDASGNSGIAAAEYVGTMDRGVEALLGRGARGRPGADAGRGQRLAGGREDAGAVEGEHLMARARQTAESKQAAHAGACGGVIGVGRCVAGVSTAMAGLQGAASSR